MCAQKEIEIKRFLNPSLFIYKNLDNEVLLQLPKLEVDLQKYADDFKKINQKVDFMPEVGETVLGFNSDLNKWYRFKVLFVDRIGTFKTELCGLDIDTGKIGVVKLKRTIPLLDKNLAAEDLELFSFGGLHNAVPAKQVSHNFFVIFSLFDFLLTLQLFIISFFFA